jgi:hypothetical protein
MLPSPGERVEIEEVVHVADRARPTPVPRSYEGPNVHVPCVQDERQRRADGNSFVTQISHYGAAVVAGVADESPPPLPAKDVHPDVAVHM